VTPDRAAALQQAVGIAPGTFSERLAAAGPDAQAVYGAVLPAFAATGRPPGPDTLAARTGLAPDRVRVALGDLAAADLLALHPDGKIAGAFPLSATPTRHRVQVQGRPVLHAMCAVDALGIPAMLGAAGTVTSTDPATGQPIEVQVAVDGSLDVTPPGAVVLLARTGDGPLASACCSVIDFHADRASAEDVLRGQTRGAVLTVTEAHALGVLLFGALPADR
jgi:hypothetical protein